MLFEAVAFLFPLFTAKVQRSPSLWAFVLLRHPPPCPLGSWAERKAGAGEVAGVARLRCSQLGGDASALEPGPAGKTQSEALVRERRIRKR